MAVLMVILRVLVVLILLYLFLIAPNVLHRKLKQKEWGGGVFAHRGLHDDNHRIPENSMTAFRLAVEKGYGIELDVHLTRDRQIVVHHENSLKRLCGEDKLISETPMGELLGMRLIDTDERIPTLAEVLDLVRGQVPLIIEVKSDHPGNVALAASLNTQMQRYRGAWCVESFDPLMMRWFKKHAPSVVRGQLAMDPKKKRAGKYDHVRQFFM